MLNPRCNDLLDQLNFSQSAHVFAHLSLVSLTEGQSIYETGDLIDQVYFPVTALLGVAQDMSDGSSIDVATVGRDGAIGFGGLTNKSLNRIYVTHSGLAYQISLMHLKQLENLYLNSQLFLNSKEKNDWMTQMHLRATQSNFDLAVIETACAHFHTTSERLPRWILNRSKHTQSTHIKVTHQKIANSLGVRREAVTNALLKIRGIDCSRNAIEIQNMDELEAQTCECYRLSWPQ